MFPYPALCALVDVTLSLPGEAVLQLAESLGARLAGFQQQRPVTGDQHETRADLDIALRQIDLTHARHAGMLAVLTTSRHHGAISLGDLEITELARNAEIDAEVAGADQQHVHAFERRNPI